MKRSGLVLALLGLAAGASAPAPARAAQTIAVGARSDVPSPAPAGAPGSGWLGVRSQLMVEMEADGSSATASRLTITDVYRDGPAWQVGIRAGDVVLGVNGLPLRLDRFQSLAQRLVPGDPVSLTVQRGTRQLEFSLEASARPGAEVLVPRQLQAALDSTRVVFLTRLDSVEHTLPTEMPFRLELRRIEADSVQRVEINGLFEWTSSVDPQGPRPFTTWAYHGGYSESRGPVYTDSVRVVVSSTPRVATARVRETAVAPTPAPSPRPEFPVQSPARPSTSRSTEGYRSAEVPVRPLAPYVAGMNRVAGAEFTPLAGELATYFQAEDGLLVTDVAEGTPAGDAGLTPGDVIIAVRGKRVTTVHQLRAALSVHESSPLLTVIRRGQAVELRLPD